jgi:hypothetical protein
LPSKDRNEGDREDAMARRQTRSGAGQPHSRGSPTHPARSPIARGGRRPLRRDGPPPTPTRCSVFFAPVFVPSRLRGRLLFAVRHDWVDGRVPPRCGGLCGGRERWIDGDSCGRAGRNKKPGGPSGSPGVQCVLCCTDSGPKVVVRGGGSGCPGRPQLPEQPRVPQESHLTVAAHSSSHVQSQSVTDHLRFGRAKSVDNGSWPCPAVTGNFEGDCRTRLWGQRWLPPGRRP